MTYLPKELPDVQPGQVWEYRERAYAGSLIRVTRVFDARVYGEPINYVLPRGSEAKLALRRFYPHLRNGFIRRKDLE